ncbi:MAG: hypothetical protein ABL997_17905, partial [Planctomycetota bacterium]
EVADPAVPSEGERPSPPAAGDKPAPIPKPEPVGIPVPVAAPRDTDIEKPTGAAPLFERKSFRARASLIVTVPQYIRWTRLEWEDR